MNFVLLAVWVLPAVVQRSPDLIAASDIGAVASTSRVAAIARVARDRICEVNSGAGKRGRQRQVKIQTVAGESSGVTFTYGSQSKD